jgi:RNA polymerase sigma factor (sigma-70 family)
MHHITVRPSGGRGAVGGETRVTIDALRAGRPEVLDELLDRYGREVQGVAYLVLRDRAAAEDVVVDTLLTALDRGGQLRDPEALRPWLLRIAVNHALGARRSAARVVQLTVLPEQAGPRAEAEDRLTLLACLDRLAPRMRAAVVLRYYADLPVRDVAEALGTSQNTVKTQLREALRQMRIAIAAEADPPEVAHG